MKSSKTYNRIIDHALNQAVIVGLEGLSFGSLASALGLSKSGLFAHFDSKAGLQKAIVEAAVKCFTHDVILPAMQLEAGTNRLRQLYFNYIDWFAGNKSLNGCPFTGFIQEFDDKPGDVRDLLLENQLEWRILLRDNVIVSQERVPSSRQDKPDQIVFELIGAALSFQMSFRLLREKDAYGQVKDAFENIVGIDKLN